jgi:phycobilisome core-membrane linker protein
MKAVEYIHRRLLGRPTYGRQETNRYFDICAKQGFYALVDAIIDSPEYNEVFGEDVVPDERYLTPAGVSGRSLRAGSVGFTGALVKPEEPTPKFVDLGTPSGIRSQPDINTRVAQGVSKRREQRKVFKLTSTLDKVQVKTVIGAAYRQVFERNIDPYIVQNEFSALESKLGNGEINVKEFIEGLGCSKLYIREFYTPYPNTKVIELGTKHFLGRAPRDQAEIRQYNQILAAEGIKGFIGAMVNSMEYLQAFGEDVVPYNRFPTLPAANFPNTERLYTQLTKQNKDLVVPSFTPVVSRMGTPETISLENGNPLYVELGRTSGNDATAPATSQSTRVYRKSAAMSASDVEDLIQAVYRQVMDVYSDAIPAELRVLELDAQFRNGSLSVQAFVEALVTSDVYRRRFCEAYPMEKVAEFLLRHVLGRVALNQDELAKLSQRLIQEGLQAVTTSMLQSAEYATYFGVDTGPYKRF